MSKTFVIGDIHGAYKALLQCLERSSFDKENDTLITLGDIADGWPQVPECVDELLTISSRIDIRGNHDEWLYLWLSFGLDTPGWTEQGGKASKDAYINTGMLMSKEHKEFFKTQKAFYVDKNNNLFVHGGFDWKRNINAQSNDMLQWDRYAFNTACYCESQSKIDPEYKAIVFKDYNEVFVGHTCTNHKLENTIGNSLEPVHVANMWNLDQGAGWDGKLSIMNVDTKEYWQSDIVKELYPLEKGR